MRRRSAYLFDEFLSSGLEESVSPFLTSSSKSCSKNLPLKTSICSAIFLLISFVLSFFLLPLSYGILVIVYVLAGTKALIDTIEDLKNFEINIDVLMTLAAFLSILIKSPMEGALLLVLFALSGALEDMVCKKSRSALHELTHLAPSIIPTINDEGLLIEKSVKDIEVNTKILVQAGEVIPLDGVVVAGESFVNMVHLTGESQPLAKKVGDDVQAGSRNLDGSLTVEVKKTSSESTLARIASLVQEAQSSKPKIERFLDKFSKIYATSIIGLAAFFALILPFILHIPFSGVEGSIYRALAFLIAASPCALIIATPTAYLSAMSASSKKGILLKGGSTLDALAACQAIAFDKTGTLTTGNLEILSFERLYGDIDSKLALSLAGSIEAHAKHPIAQSIVAYAKQENSAFFPIQSFNALAGRGLEAEAIINQESYHITIGQTDFIFSKLEGRSYVGHAGSDQDLAFHIYEYLKRKNHPFCLLIINNSVFAFEFKDELRSSVGFDLHKLKQTHSLKLYMLTGDHEEAAREVASQTHMDEFFFNLRPEGKMKLISSLSEKTPLTMVGDGINDAPALSRATVGISMGAIGSFSAIEASDIVLLHDDLSLLCWLFSKAKQTAFIVRENLSLALLVILTATTPALLGFIPLWLAVILHEGGTVLVGLNSLRLLKK